MEQNWLLPYPIGYDGNKVFKEQLSILTSIQVCKITSLRTDEEILEEFESEDQTLALKITSEDSASDRDPNYEEVNSKESQPLVIQTLKLQKSRRGL